MSTFVAIPPIDNLNSTQMMSLERLRLKNDTVFVTGRKIPGGGEVAWQKFGGTYSGGSCDGYLNTKEISFKNCWILLNIGPNGIEIL